MSVDEAQLFSVQCLSTALSCPCRGSGRGSESSKVFGVIKKCRMWLYNTSVKLAHQVPPVEVRPWALVPGNELKAKVLGFLLHYIS